MSSQTNPTQCTICIQSAVNTLTQCAICNQSVCTDCYASYVCSSMRAECVIKCMYCRAIYNTEALDSIRKCYAMFIMEYKDFEKAKTLSKDIHKLLKYLDVFTKRFDISILYSLFYNDRFIELLADEYFYEIIEESDSEDDD